MRAQESDFLHHLTEFTLPIKYEQTLKASWIETPLGSMIALADEKTLYFLEFGDRLGLKKDMAKFCLKTKSMLTNGNSQPLISIKKELDAYFAGKLKTFHTPFSLTGSPFQKQAWEVLTQIPYGHTRSYREQAIALGHPMAYRAVANANGSNHLAIILPCHRIINTSGNIGGYGGGIARKKWLLELEQKFRNVPL